jgi:putative acetyltransferase
LNINEIEIVLIEAKYNTAIAAIIRAALEEFGANKPGTVYFDSSTDALYELFNTTTIANTILLYKII